MATILPLVRTVGKSSLLFFARILPNPECEDQWILRVYEANLTTGVVKMTQTSQEDPDVLKRAGKMGSVAPEFEGRNKLLALMIPFKEERVSRAAKGWKEGVESLTKKMQVLAREIIEKAEKAEKTEKE